MATFPTYPPARQPIANADDDLRVDRNWLAFFQALLTQSAAGSATTGVTPGTYGDASHVGRFTVDAQGRLTFAANVAIAALNQYMPVCVGGLAVSVGNDLAVIPWVAPLS